MEKESNIHGKEANAKIDSAVHERPWGYDRVSRLILITPVKRPPGVLFPLLLCGMLGKVDVEAVTEGGGYSGQAGAIRYGIAHGLVAFVPRELTQKMQAAGLLQKDPRVLERQKAGQQGARRKYTWKKR